MQPTVGTVVAGASCTGCALHRLCESNGISAETLHALRDRVVSSHRHPARSYLFHQGDKRRALYALRSGSAKAVLTDAQGSELIVDFYFPGDLIDDSTPFDDVHTESVMLIERSDVCELPVSAVRALVGNDSSVLATILNALASLVRTRSSAIARLGPGGADRRVAAFLVDMQRRSTPGHGGAVFRVPMSRYDIGGYLELAPETVSRAIQRLSAAGVLRVSGKLVEIIDQSALAAVADGNASTRTMSRDEVRIARG